MRSTEPGPDDVRAAVDLVTSALAPLGAQADRWDEPAGSLSWTCRETLVHVVRCLTSYSARLARRELGGPVEAPMMALHSEPATLLDSLRSMGAILASVVAATAPDDRAWHPYGIADGSGFAAMGCDEVLVHGADLASAFAIAFEPPRPLCERVLRRLFPWAPEDADPWEALLWANGRRPLGQLPPERDWLWHCAPLTEWDGRIRRLGR